MAGPPPNVSAPACAREGCGHRRIHHTMTAATRGRKGGIEVLIPCSLPDCECGEYVPPAVAAPTGEVVE